MRKLGDKGRLIDDFNNKKEENQTISDYAKGRKLLKSEKVIDMPTLFGNHALNYRGMSAQEIFNLKQVKKNTENSQIPVITTFGNNSNVTVTDHVSNDPLDSPWKSFEKNDMGVSVGKYAPKPVGSNRIPKGLDKQKQGNTEYFRLPKSYDSHSLQDYPFPQFNRMGYVLGISDEKSNQFNPVDISTQELAKPYFESTSKRNNAVGDKELLLNLGNQGMKFGDVSLIQKIKRVLPDYYLNNLKKQSERKSLGVFKSAGSETPSYYKLQIPSNYNEGKEIDGYNIPAVLKKDDDTSSMSSIESMEFPGENSSSSSSNPITAVINTLKRKISGELSNINPLNDDKDKKGKKKKTGNDSD